MVCHPRDEEYVVGREEWCRAWYEEMEAVAEGGRRECEGGQPEVGCCEAEGSHLCGR